MEEQEKKDNASLEKELERIEGVIEELRKDEGYDEEEPKHKKALENKKTVVFAVGLGGLSFLILLGVYLIYHLLFFPQRVEVSKATPGMKKEALEVKKEASKREGEGEAKLSTEQVKEVKGNFTSGQRYTLELKDFLFPYGKEGFLKVDVYCYYSDYESFKQAKASELILREALYEYFSGKTLRQEELKNTQFLEEELKRHLMKRNLKAVPQVLEVEGVILRS